MESKASDRLPDRQEGELFMRSQGDRYDGHILFPMPFARARGGLWSSSQRLSRVCSQKRPSET